tara:strand:+ start:102019 stop:103878 length:1860 start_codon:yes stop_codon:yes gene_type:complete
MKAYSGEHTQGCHKCGGFPGSLKTPVHKLYQCLKCGFFTCNKHLQGGALSKKCPNCESSGKDLRSVMTKESHSRVKAGGMPGKVIAKAQIKKGEAQTESEDGPVSTFGGGSMYSSKSSSSNTGISSAVDDAKKEIQQTVQVDKRVQDAMMTSIKREVDSLQKQMETMHELATISSNERPILKDNKSEETHLKLSEEDLSSKSLSDLLDENSSAATPLTSSLNYVADEDHDETVDMEALDQIGQLLKEQEQGYSLTRKILTDCFFRVESPQGIPSCANYLKSKKDSIHIISIDAKKGEIMNDLKELIHDSQHVFGCIGFSPKNIQGGKRPDIEDLKYILDKNKKFVAIGEISLDMHFAPQTIELQKELFIEQTLLSVERDMPLFISSKKADREVYDTLNILREEGIKVRGIMVPVVRTVEMFQMVLDHGFHLLLRPEITHDAEDLYRECLKELPIEKLLLASGEEISPPKKHFGRWNSPEYINDTITYASEMFNMQPHDFIKQMAINFNKIFNSDPEASDDEFNFTPTAMQQTLLITEEKLLENDSDVDGDKLFIKEIDDSQLVGTVYFDRDKRTFLYTPRKEFIGSDKFKYIVADGRGGFDSATVTINVSKPYEKSIVD